MFSTRWSLNVSMLLAIISLVCYKNVSYTCMYWIEHHIHFIKNKTSESLVLCSFKIQYIHLFKQVNVFKTDLQYFWNNNFSKYFQYFTKGLIKYWEYLLASIWLLLSRHHCLVALWILPHFKWGYLHVCYQELNISHHFHYFIENHFIWKYIIMKPQDIVDWMGWNNLTHKHIHICRNNFRKK